MTFNHKFSLALLIVQVAHSMDFSLQ